MRSSWGGVVLITFFMAHLNGLVLRAEERFQLAYQLNEPPWRVTKAIISTDKYVFVLGDGVLYRSSDGVAWAQASPSKNFANCLVVVHKNFIFNIQTNWYGVADVVERSIDGET